MLYSASDVERVPTDSRICVLLTTLFTVPPGGDPAEPSQRCPRKTFISAILEGSGRGLQGSWEEVAEPVCLLEAYDPALPYAIRVAAGAGRVARDPTLPASHYLYAAHKQGLSVGCPHYVRGCLLYCAVCGERSLCRFCHDASHDDHEFPRTRTAEVFCLFCRATGPIGLRCTHCQMPFGTRYCETCRLICGMGREGRPSFHCARCGTCRQGLPGYSEHCERCGTCHTVALGQVHACAPDPGNCVYCLDGLRDNIYPYIVLPCGRHSCHRHCYEAVFRLGGANYKCPVCRRLVLFGQDRELYEARLEELRGSLAVPPEYRGVFVDCACHECGGLFVARRHHLYRCPGCGSHNAAERGLFRGAAADARRAIALQARSGAFTRTGRQGPPPAGPQTG
eukprot:XP_001705430.1 Zinc finger domain [Giardia lamblia ATCC 50803]